MVFYCLKWRCRMVSQEKIKRKITDDSILVNPQAETLDIKVEQKESTFCVEKEKSKKDQVRLTIEELRSCKGFEAISESEAQYIIENLFQLAVIVYNFQN